MDNRILRGTLRQYERPIWQPLLDLLGEGLVETMRSPGGNGSFQGRPTRTHCAPR